MDDKKIIKISLSIFLIVFILGYLYEQNYEYELSEISDFDLEDLNSKVKFEAKIVKQNLYGETLFLELKDKEDSIKAIVFKHAEKLDYSLEYYFIGKVTYRNKNVEIIVDRIIKK